MSHTLLEKKVVTSYICHHCFPISRNITKLTRVFQGKKTRHDNEVLSVSMDSFFHLLVITYTELGSTVTKDITVEIR